MEETIFNKGKMMNLNEFRKVIIECLEENSVQDVQDTFDDAVNDFVMGRVYMYDNDDDNYSDFEPIRNTKRGWK